MHKPSCPNSDYAERGYYKHLDHPSRWRFRKAIEQALSSAIALGTPRLEAFGRCAVLRTAQWALDGRNKLPTIEEFRTCLRSTAKAMVVGARELRVSISENGRYPVTVLNRSAAGLEEDQRVDGLRAPRLVVTSPPYPGVHVLYHRWQVDGRKEAPLPFMIANKHRIVEGRKQKSDDRSGNTPQCGLSRERKAALYFFRLLLLRKANKQKYKKTNCSLQ